MTQKLATIKRQPLQDSPVPLLPPVLHFESWWTECTQTGEPFQVGLGTTLRSTVIRKRGSIN
jgi:hypothetical protein